jgi:hypothetical protein
MSVKTILALPTFVVLWFICFLLSVLFTVYLLFPILLKAPGLNCSFGTVIDQNGVVNNEKTEGLLCKTITAVPYLTATLLSSGIFMSIFLKKSPHKKK